MSHKYSEGKHMTYLRYGHIPLEMRHPDKWPIEEREILQEMIKHYGADFQSIAFEMTRTIGLKRYRPSNIESYYICQNQLRDLTTQEAKDILNFYCTNIGDMQHNIWTMIYRRFPQWIPKVLNTKFKHYICTCFRKINYFYNIDKELTLISIARLGHMDTIVLHAIFFLSQKELNLFEKQDENFCRIAKSAKKLVRLLGKWIEQDLIDIENEEFVMRRINQSLQVPYIGPIEFQQVIEDILTLEQLILLNCCQSIICKVIFGLNPYTYDDEQILRNPVIELEDMGIAPRVPRKNCTNLQQRAHLAQVESIKERQFRGDHEFQMLRIKEKIAYDYPEISLEQMQLLTRSSFSTLLIPYISTIKQNQHQKRHSIGIQLVKL